MRLDVWISVHQNTLAAYNMPTKPYHFVSQSPSPPAVLMQTSLLLGHASQCLVQKDYINHMYEINNLFAYELYCIERVVIAAQCTATFSDLLCSPEFRYYDVNMPIKFCSEVYFFSGFGFFNLPEISDSGSSAYIPSQRTCAQDFYVLKKFIDVSRV